MLSISDSLFSKAPYILVRFINSFPFSINCIRLNSSFTGNELIKLLSKSYTTALVSLPIYIFLLLPSTAVPCTHKYSPGPCPLRPIWRIKFPFLSNKSTVLKSFTTILSSVKTTFLISLRNFSSPLAFILPSFI